VTKQWRDDLNDVGTGQRIALIPSFGVVMPPVRARDGRTRPYRMATHRSRTSSSALDGSSACGVTFIVVMSTSG
jgi:hypothetical protein